MGLYKNKTVAECEQICDLDDNCRAFEYGVDYGNGATKYEAMDCQPQSTASGVKYYKDKYNLDLYIKTVPRGYTCKPGHCIDNENIDLYKNKSVTECAEICNRDDNCRGFEYGVDYGTGVYEARDCQPQSTAIGFKPCTDKANLDLCIRNTESVPLE